MSDGRVALRLKEKRRGVEGMGLCTGMVVRHVRGRGKFCRSIHFIRLRIFYTNLTTYLQSIGRSARVNPNRNLP